MKLVLCTFYERVYFGAEKCKVFKPISHLYSTEIAFTWGRKFELAKTVLTAV